jgi:hypothetical protein
MQQVVVRISAGPTGDFGSCDAVVQAGSFNRLSLQRSRRGGLAAPAGAAMVGTLHRRAQITIAHMQA